MNDFNGLGIVLEEKDSNGDSSYLENNTDNLNSPRTSNRVSTTEIEILLPPLPHGDIDLNRTPSLSNSNTDEVNTFDSYNSGDFEGSRRGSDFSDFLNKQHDFSNYELDSPNLKIDNNFHMLPSLSKSNQQGIETNSSNSGINLSTNSSNTTTNNNSNNTSPLKRLKSLKKGIRKLSLTSLSSNSRSSSSGILGKPEMTPLSTDSRSSDSSNRSSLSNMDTFSVYSNQAQGSGSISKLKRTRTHSCSMVNTPLTPPISSPVVTVSENLSAAKKSLYTTEQSYFESLNMRSSNSAFNNFENGSTFEADQIKNADTNSLVNYLKFLKQQKKSVIDAYELTKTKLANSGWCSDHDLNNIQLQQDTSLCQIDTKLSQIKEELRKETNIECDLSPSYKSSTSHEKENPLQSLKLLENRYLSMAESQKNL